MVIECKGQNLNWRQEKEKQLEEHIYKQSFYRICLKE